MKESNELVVKGEEVLSWFCLGCGERRGGTLCKRRCREKYGDAGAERVPPLDGVVFFNDDGSGIPRYELMRQREAVGRCSPRTVRGPRPQGWEQAMERIGARAAVVIGSGLPEGVEC